MKRSLIENLINRIPLPYAITSLVLVLLVVFGTSLSLMVDTHNFQTAFYYLSASPISQIVFLIGNIFLPMFALLSTKYLKEKVTSKDSDIIQICPQGPNSLEKVFKISASTLPVVVLAVLLVLPTIINQSYKQSIVGPVTMVLYPLALVIISIIYATALWTYISLFTGLYRLGRQPLTLTPFYIDNTLGLKPLGNLSLQMTFVYFIGIFLILLQIFLIPQISFAVLAEIAALIALGVVLFFLPLYSAHKRLVKEKHTLLMNHRSRLNDLSFGINSSDSTFENLNQQQASGLIASDIIERKIMLISDWPMDPTMVRTLSALIISTVTTLAGRLLLLIIHI